MLSLQLLWNAFLSLLLIAGMIMIILLILVFLMGFAKSYQGNRAQDGQHPQPVPQEKIPDPYQSPEQYLQGPRLGDKPDSENPNEFCPVCHYHWTVCANTHVLHHEPVPLSIIRNTERSDQA